MAGLGGVRPGAGRPKGVPNKITTTAKEAIQAVFDELGGTKALIEWCKSDPDHMSVFFERIYPKILPHQITGSDGGAGIILQIMKFGEKDED